MADRNANMTQREKDALKLENSGDKEKTKGVIAGRQLKADLRKARERQKGQS